MSRTNYILTCILLLSLQHAAFGQDPFSSLFFNSRLLYNPGFTGDKGAASFSVKYKSQWNSTETSPYKTGSIVYEESLPCSILDYGFKFTYDQEGDGLFKTLEAGALIVATPSIRTLKANHNFRIGADISWGIQSVNYDKLIFSDQLDPQFGVNHSSSFIPPNDGRSSVYFNPGLGLVYKGLFNYNAKRPQILTLGIAVYNIYSFQNGIFSNSRSVLGLTPYQSLRWTAVAEYEWIPYLSNGNYISVKPILFYQIQNNIQSTDLGSRLGISKWIAFGMYVHFNNFDFSKNTGWINFNSELSWKLNDNRRIDLSFTYCTNYSGLQNFAGPLFEIGIAYHFRKLTQTCGSPEKVNCSSFTSTKNKIYDNIWY